MADDILKYEFASTGGGMEDGFNNPAIEHFVGNPSYYLARESVQNILDAKIDREPAIAKFSEFDIRSQDIPKRQSLLQILSACNSYETKNPKSKEFYRYAYESLKGDSYLKGLRIDDFNTTGMSGNDNDRNGKYHRFMKSFGVAGNFVGAGGFFGLGKAAYYAASNYRMIFVSSIYPENGEKKYLFQGKLLLNSFQMNGDTKKGDGSFGMEGQKAVRDATLIPEMFRRDGIGTSIFIISFKDHRSWKEKILRSILENFWPAITDNLLEVEIDGIDINDGSIKEIMEGEYKTEEPDLKDRPNPLPYFSAYTYTGDDRGSTYEKELEILGKVKLFTLVGEGLPSKTAFARSAGMIVQKEGRYYCPKNHASFFYCKNPKGNEILRRMENPTHSEWRAKNGSTVDGVPDPELAAAEKELRIFIKEAHSSGSDINRSSLRILNLEQYLYSPEDEKIDADGVSNKEGTVFEGISDEETGSETGALEKELDRLKIKIPKTKRLKAVRFPIKEIKVIENPEGELETSGGGRGGGEKFNPYQPGTPDDTGKKRRVSIPMDFRSFCPYGRDNIHILNLRNENKETERIEIEVYAVADEEPIALPILNAVDSTGTGLQTDNNKISLTDLKESENLKIRFKESGRYSLIIKAYEIR